MSLKNLENKIKFKDNFLYRYLLEAPIALAVERSLECDILAQKEFHRPILDIGCGEGMFAYILFDERIDVGIDPDGDEIKKAQAYGMYDELIECFGNEIPKEDGSFNTIFSNSVLEHIPDLQPVLKEAHRLLAPGGKFYVTIPTDMFDHYTYLYQFLTAIKLNGLAERYRKFFNNFWEHFNYHDYEGWKTRFEEAGFEVVEHQEYDTKPTCLLNNFFVPFAIPSLIKKRLTNKWLFSKRFRKFYIGPIYSIVKKLVKKFERQPKGGIIFFALTKKV